LILEELPQKISSLVREKKIEISFPESWMTIYLEPVDSSTLKCSWRNYGDSIAEEEFTLDKYQVEKTLKHFLEEILTKAVQEGYITSIEKEKFLQPSVKSIK
jgi:hypothetical protein